jgi:hypothetical protein
VKITKHISILLTTLLLITNIGLAFNVHYCGDNIASVSLKIPNSNTDFEKDCCGKVIEKSSCCKDKVIKFEKKSENTIAKSIGFDVDYDFIILEYNTFFYTYKANFKHCNQTSYTCNANAPPIFKRNCQFIFYA